MSVEKKEVRQELPLLYDLTTLQKEMNSKYGFSVDKTLSIAQKLYEAKLITYPRTGSRYISEDIFDTIYNLVSTLWEHPIFGQQAVGISNSELNRHSVNDKKVTDHHALLITGNEAKDLPYDEYNVYERITGRMVAAFSKICIKAATTIKLNCADILFEVKSSVTKNARWRKVWGEQEDKDENEAAALPNLSENETLPVQDVELLEKQTKPRPLHTESSLLSSMATCGKELSDEAEREALKESAIGTPATRASIIETATQITTELIDTKIEDGDNRESCAYLKCKSGQVIIYRKVAKCNNESYGLTVFCNKSEKELTDRQIKDLLTKGKTGIIKGFKSRVEKPFDAVRTFDSEFKTVFSFAPKAGGKKKGRK